MKAILFLTVFIAMIFAYQIGLNEIPTKAQGAQPASPTSTANAAPVEALPESDSYPLHWRNLLERIRYSQHPVTICTKSGDCGDPGSIFILTDDYLCTTQGGWSNCYPLDVIVRVKTSPGTFGDSKQGR